MSESNVRIRTNVIARERANDPVVFRSFLTWPELHIYAETFYTNHRTEIIQRMTPEQDAERKFMQRVYIKLPPAFHAICTAQDCALPPVSQPAFYENDLREAKLEIHADIAVVPPVIVAIRDEERSPQKVAIEAPLLSKTVVLAPPGTGKTFAVIQRLMSLARGELFGALDRVLLVSFSRTAVGELRRRLENEMGGSGCGAHTLPRIHTLDSFAGTILARVRPNALRTEGNYDASIRALAEILEGSCSEAEGMSAAAFVSQMVQCIIVDEVQDIVGERARLIAALLGAIQSSGPHGFMMLGDLRQAIFTFQLRDLPPPSSEHDAFWLVKRVRNLYPQPERQDLSFEESFRYQTPESRDFAQRLRNTMDDPTGSCLPGENPNAKLLGEILKTVAEMDDPAELLSAEFAGKRIAVLARYREQAERLWVACRERFKNRGTKVRLQRAANEGRAPAWIARLFNGTGPLMSATRTAFVERYRMWVLNDVTLASESWDWLIEGLKLPDGFSRDELVAKIRARPTALSDPPMAHSDAIHVSTIHLAKGREFDVVVVADLERIPQANKPEECRIAYVAATRAKRHLFRCSGNRWLERVFDWTNEIAGDFDVTACASVERIGGTAEWHRGQEALWQSGNVGAKGATLYYSPAENRFVLTSRSVPADLIAPIVLSESFRARFSAFANVTLHTDPCVGEFACEILEMNTHYNPDCPGELMLLPLLSGIIRRR